MNKAELIKFIEERDTKYESPQKRAERIWEIIQVYSKEPISDWDVVCFCTNYIGQASAQHLFLAQLARKLNHIVYDYHYAMPESELELDKKMKLLGVITDERIQDIQGKHNTVDEEVRNKIARVIKLNKGNGV